MEIYRFKSIKKWTIKKIQHVKSMYAKNINNNIKNLQNKFSITYYAIISKEYYKHLLHNSINTNNVFSKTSLKIEINNTKLWNYHKSFKA